MTDSQRDFIHAMVLEEWILSENNFDIDLFQFTDQGISEREALEEVRRFNQETFGELKEKYKNLTKKIAEQEV